jgi:glycosyltransferase involved in cell wall biosynthesis
MAQKICLVGGIYPPDAGGPSRFIWEFEKYLLEKGNAVSVLVLTDAESSKQFLPNLTKIRITRNTTLPKRFLRFIQQLRRLDSQNHNFLVVGAFLEVVFANLKRTSRVVVKIPGDIVWERARNSGKTNLDIFGYQKSVLPFKYKLMRHLYTKSLNRAAKVIVPSEGLRKLTEIWGIDQSRVVTIYNSVESQTYDGIRDASDLVDVLTVCRLTEWKGVDELIEAVSALNLSLTIIGDGPEKGNLEILAGSLGARVNFLGELGATEVSAYYKRARRFVLNSKYEGLPHVLLEARASKLLCLARDGTGSSEVITHLYDGILYGEESGLNLVDALKLSFSSQIDEDEYIERAFQDINLRFNQNRNFAQILQVLTNGE